MHEICEKEDVDAIQINLGSVNRQGSFAGRTSLLFVDPSSC
jgi:hypothetical protein